MDVEIDEELREAERQYLDFLDDGVTDQGVYAEVVRHMIQKNQCRIIVNINDLRRKNEIRAKRLLDNSSGELGAFQRALKGYVASIDTVFAKQYEEFFVGFEGSFGSKHVTPRTLTSSYLGNLVCIEGIITKCSLVRPKVVRSVHYCPATKKTLDRKYTDLTSSNPFPSSTVYPTKDEDNNPLETEFGLSVYKDHQTLTVQEMPEKAPAGQLPRSVDIIADDDLVDQCKPGDRVQVIGAYRCLPGKKGGHTSGVFRTILIATNIKSLSKDVQLLFSGDDIAKIRKFAKQRHIDVFDTLARSLAPSIHGHDYIKKAVLCMLLGGTEKVLDNGTRLRGDINVLLIGDPSTAKSQMLRYVLNTAPRAITTTGRGTTGVGLTAAVTADDETGERRLEAGAMVLADRGVVCIDEFDKMSDIDRTAIHEVMEQGRVTVAKAGIHAKLNARCSVLAAANPVYGRYDQYKPPMDNIGMQDSLLSRFDLLFIVLDQMEPANDRRISDHVLRIHRYRSPAEQDGDPLPTNIDVDCLSTDNPEATDQQKEDTPIYEKHNQLLHGDNTGKSKPLKLVSMEFIKRYIHVAKVIKPTLSREAANCIAEEYARLRCQDQANTDVARTTPVTARTLETLIRLATAHAKARLARSVSLRDAEVAIELVQFAYFHKVEEKERKRRRNDDDQSEAEEEEETDSRKKKRKRAARNQDDDTNDPYNFDSAEEDIPEIGSPAPTSTTDKEDESMEASAPPIGKERLDEFRKAVHGKFQAAHKQSLSVSEIITWANKQATAQFSSQEANACLSQMMDDNQVMVSDNIVFLI
ncbi:zygotic DNA replication licensing factor mcm3-like [Clavelina lepadiformis]|uniref:zygotic DNA replication licensing factor mcm3-like n=1 Tax=Clavelina lepadiformis TaxID=159417 RepID=UPI0040421E14